MGDLKSKDCVAFFDLSSRVRKGDEYLAKNKFICFELFSGSVFEQK